MQVVDPQYSTLSVGFTLSRSLAESPLWKIWQERQMLEAERCDRYLCEQFHSDGKETQVKTKKSTTKRARRVPFAPDPINVAWNETMGRMNERLDLFEDWRPPEPVRPRTVCDQCVHVHDTYDSYNEEISYECLATTVAWSPVTGDPTWALCADVNDGECPKWEARAPVPEIQAGTGSDPYVSWDTPGVGSVETGMAYMYPTSPASCDMFPQPAAAWWPGVVATVLVIGSVVGWYVWFVAQHGWRWW